MEGHYSRENGVKITGLIKALVSCYFLCICGCCHCVSVTMVSLQVYAGEVPFFSGNGLKEDLLLKLLRASL